jgi:S-DNA-T family DNA segregation ATPase FtsK/SpoIIIE
MRVGFTRAARMIDTMESMGIVGPQNGAKPREILVDEGEALEILEQFREGR